MSVIFAGGGKQFTLRLSFWLYSLLEPKKHSSRTYKYIVLEEEHLITLFFKYVAIENFLLSFFTCHSTFNDYKKLTSLVRIGLLGYVLPFTDGSSLLKFSLTNRGKKGYSFTWVMLSH